MMSLRIPRKIKIACWSVSILLLLYTLTGFVILPALLSNQAPKLIREHLKREATVAEIRFNPFSLEFEIDKFLIKNTDGSDFVRFDRFYTNLAVLKSIKEGHLIIDQIELANPFVGVKRDHKGDFNFSDLLSSEPTKPETNTNTGLFPVKIAKINLSDGALDWQNHSSGQNQRESIKDFNLTLDALSTLPDATSNLNLSLHLASGGELNWQGSLGVNPILSNGHVELNRVKLRRIWELLLKDSLPLEPLSGQELIKADYRMGYSDAGLQLNLDNAAVVINDVKLAEPDQQDALIQIPELNVDGISFDLQKQRVELASVSSKKAHFATWLNPDGTLNYQTLFAGKPDEPSTATTDHALDEQRPWQVVIDQLTLDDFSVQFTDKTLKDPVQIVVSQFSLSSHGLDNQPGSRLPFELSLQINEQGKLAIRGESVIEPFSAQLHIDTEDIAIADFQPYIDQGLKLDILSGLFNANIDLSLQQPENQALAISLQGNSHISEFASKDRVSKRDFVNWRSLNLDGIKLDLAKNSYFIEKVSFDKPYARVLIRKDKSINVNDIVVKHEPTQSEIPQAEAPKPAATFRINSVNLHDGETDFADFSLILPFAAHINQLGGATHDISSAPDSVTKIKLAGKVDSLAPVDIEGKINLHSGDSEFTLDFSSMPMPLMTPYMVEFAGRKIEKGNMSLGLQYKIENKQLSASNKLLIENLVLGDKVENPQAVSLPLDFAVALLQDSDGKIALDMPVTGSLEDPEFSTAGIIVDALVNVITKAISSPFTALASLVDSDEDLGVIAFPAGSAELSDDDKKKLDDVAKILSNRPKLKLEIKGAALSATDWPPLQPEALTHQLQELKEQELKQQFPNKPVPGKIVLSNEDYNRLLEDLFIKRYPKLAERNLLGKPRLLNLQMGDFHEIAKTRLAADISPEPERLQQLANKRAQAIAKYLVADGIAVNRLFLRGAEIDSADHQDTQLNLTVR